jgi:hypothetical protein
MRMWLVNPKIMCRKHLLGEHLELHMLVGCLRKQKNIKGYLENGLADPSLIIDRHRELVAEMKHRGYKHFSPIGEFPQQVSRCNIDSKKNVQELVDRCLKCRELKDLYNE